MTPTRAQNEVTVATVAGAMSPSTRYLPGETSRAGIAVRQRRAEQVDVEPGGGGEPQLGGRVAGQLGGCALGDHPAVVDDHHPVGEQFGLVQQMGGEQDGHPVPPHRSQQLPHQVPGLRIHARGGFVQEEQLRPSDQRHGQAQSLQLPAGQPPHRGAHRIAQAEGVQQPLRVERPRRAPGDDRQHLADPGRRVRAAGLQHHPDPWPQRPALLPRVQPEDADRAGVRAGETGAHVERAGLAGAVRAEQGHQSCRAAASSTARRPPAATRTAGPARRSPAPASAGPGSAKGWGSGLAMMLRG